MYRRRTYSRRPSYGRRSTYSRYPRQRVYRGRRTPQRRSGGGSYTGQARRGYRPTARRFYYGGRFF